MNINDIFVNLKYVLHINVIYFIALVINIFILLFDLVFKKIIKNIIFSLLKKKINHN